MEKRFKILVLSDLKNITYSVIKSAVSLAKMIDADLQLFHVRKATDIVDQESQLSAKRSINRSFIKTSNDIQNLIDPYSKKYNINIEYNHAFGNVKSEIRKYLNKQKPDVVVLGKRNTNRLNLLGDNITEFVINNFEGEIVIASNENPLEPNKELSLGILNNVEQSLNTEFANNLINSTSKPLKLFKTISKDISDNSQSFASKETVELQFDYGDNSMKSLSNYLSKSDINLFCLDRVENKKVIDNVNVPILISKAQ